MAIKHKQQMVGSVEYRLGQLSAEDQARNLYLIQRHDVSGAFMSLVLFGFKKTEENTDPESAFEKLVMTILSQMQKSMSYEEWNLFVKDMLSKAFKVKQAEKDPQPVSIRDFQGDMKNMMLLVAHQMRFQYADFFCLSGQS